MNTPRSKIALLALLIGSAAHSLAAPEPSSPAIPAAAAQTLDSAVQGRSAEDRARDAARNPAQTLAFFRVEPGMTVAEGLPGGGWYTRVLAPYLGADGTLYGVDYAESMFPLFSWATPEWIAERVAKTAAFGESVEAMTEAAPRAQSFTFATVPETVNGTVDRVLLIRALHNLERFEAQAGTATAAMAAIDAMLKPGGMVGVVQHRAPESAEDSWADGSRGYLKQSAVIARFEGAGYELVASSELNANAKDQPGPDDIVWRLPPSLRGHGDDAQRKAAMEAIGESDRMTLLFRKPD